MPFFFLPSLPPSLLPSFPLSTHYFVPPFIHKFIHSPSVFNAVGTVLNAGGNSGEQAFWPPTADNLDKKNRQQQFRVLAAEAEYFQGDRAERRDIWLSHLRGGVIFQGLLKGCDILIQAWRMSKSHWCEGRCRAATLWHRGTREEREYSG